MDSGEGLLKYKPVFQQFVEANRALLACYESYSKDEVLAMGPKMDTLCINEKNTIKNILADNKMRMSVLVKERVDVMKALDAKGVPLMKIQTRPAAE